MTLDSESKNFELGSRDARAVLGYLRHGELA